MAANDPATAPSSPVHVREGEDGRRAFVFHPENDDRFVRTGRQVIDACQLGISIEVWFDELRSMIEQVASWARGRTDVAAVYAVPRGTKTMLFAIPATGRFDFDLADSMVELEAALRQFNIGPIESLQLPPEELNRFVPQGHAQPIYARS